MRRILTRILSWYIRLILNILQVKRQFQIILQSVHNGTSLRVTYFPPNWNLEFEPCNDWCQKGDGRCKELAICPVEGDVCEPQLHIMYSDPQILFLAVL